MRRGLAVAVAMLVGAGPGTAQAQPLPGTPEVFTSPNVTYVGSFKIGDGVGARVVGDRLFASTTTGFFIFDISNTESPKLLGTTTVDVEWENEDLPTNGKILGISGSTAALNCDPPTEAGNCLNLYDVTDGAAPKKLASVLGAGAHTTECVLDCTWFYGSEGQITDARDPKNPKLLEENWVLAVAEDGYALVNSQGRPPHDVTEVAPGLLLAASQTIALMSVLPEHGGSPSRPVVLAHGIYDDAGTYMHSAEWPQKGRDKFVMAAAETWAIEGGGPCTDQSASLITYDASSSLDPSGGIVRGSQWTLIDEIRPYNGTYTDGGHVVDGFGCSIHWFKPHPSFRNGGLVAASAYEHGTRLYQVGPDGRMTEQGYALPIHAEASAPHWATDGKVFYTVDYERGIDIFRYTGDLYVPTSTGEVNPTPGATPGTGGKPADVPPCASAAGFRRASAKAAGRRVRFLADRREARPFTVDVFQQSAGSKVVKERLVARFSNRTGDFTWDGRDRKRRRLADGNYFARFTMRLASGQRDVRRVTLARRGGRFRLARDFYQRVDCGTFKSLKLSSSVFGGRTREPLGIAYRLADKVGSVRVTVRVGSKVVRRFTGSGAAGKAVRFSLPAGAVRRGKRAEVLVEALRGKHRVVAVKLYADRI